MAASAKKISSTQFRTATLDRAALNEEKRTIDVTFSSEFPVERYFGVEILDHSDGSVDLSRMNGSAPLLVNHDTSAQCGVIEKAWVKDRKLMATVRFGSSAYAEEIFRDVKDGIRSLVSIGYRLMDRKTVVMEEVDGKEIYRFKSWQPYEGSIVPIPADPSVGIGRNEEPNNQTTDFELPMKRSILLNPDPAPGGGGNPAPSTPVADSPELVAKRNKERTKEILDLAKQYRDRVSDAYDLATTAIEAGQSAADFGCRVLMPKLSNAPIPNGDEPVTRTESQRGTITEVRSIGEEYIRSAAYKEFSKRNTNKFSIEIPGSITEHMKRATLTTSGLTSIQKIPGVVLVDTQPLRVADLFAQGSTSSTTIRYTKESSITNAATAVAEEGQKPEATFALAEADITVKKLAVIGRVSDESLMDYEYMQTYVNGRLIWMVQQKEDVDLLNGAGGDAITGILNVSGVQTHAHSGQSVADSIHRAITKVASTPGFVQQPDSLVIHPTDYQNLVLSKDNGGQYYAGGPFVGQYGQGGINRTGPWGLTPVITTAIAQGTALVGAFKVGAQIFRKGGLTLESTNSDASDFVYNRVAIRAEERLCLVPWRPKAFCTVTGIPLVGE